MIRTALLSIGAACVGGTLGLLLVVGIGGPSTADLDKDIGSVANELKLARAQRDLFNGGLLGIETNLWVSTLESTNAMLERKRASLLRGIQLFHEDGRGLQPTNEGQFADIDGQIAKALREANASEAEAARYTGGLIQSMALVSAATSRSSVALLEQQRIVLRYDIGIPDPVRHSGSAETLPKPAQVGKPTSDTDALK